MKRAVITGGSYAGKSTLLSEFSQKGFSIVDEAGFQIIKELNDELGMVEQKKFRTNNPEIFYTKIIKRQLELEANTPNNEETIFYDRGAHDYLAFCQLVNFQPTQLMNKLVENTQYDVVFLCETLSPFNPRKESGRSLTKEMSLDLYRILKTVYQSAGCKIVELPVMSVEKRMVCIEKELNLL